MVSDISINMGYNNNPYVIMPLKKVTDNGLKVECTTADKKDFSELLDNMNSIREADSNKDNIITLNELQKFENKSDFAQHLLDLMINYRK